MPVFNNYNLFILQNYVFFKFTLKESNESDWEIGFVRAQNLFDITGKRMKRHRTNALAKLEEFLKGFPVDSENKPCNAELLPLEEYRKKEENYVTTKGQDLNPTWYGKFVWLGDEAPYAHRRMLTNSKDTDNGIFFQIEFNTYITIGRKYKSNFGSGEIN